MNRHISSLARFFTLLTCLAAPTLARAQSMVVIPRPQSRHIAAEQNLQQVQQEFATWVQAHPTDTPDNRAFIAEMDTRVKSAQQAADATHSLHLWLGEHDAGSVWSGATKILPSSTLSPGSKDAALFSELAAQISGGWRFVLGTTLDVPTGTDSTGSSSETAQVRAQRGARRDQTADTDNEFRKFVAGGGNLSLAAMRPIGMWNREFGNHLMFVMPRAWANVPSLGNAENVSNFGGELAVEYQYERYSRTVAQSEDKNDTTPPTPFLIFQLTSGLVHGTNSFYRGIGRSEERMFAYIAPTLSFVVQDQVKLGVTYFFGPNELRGHQNLRVNLSIVPKQRKEGK